MHPGLVAFRGLLRRLLSTTWSGAKARRTALAAIVSFAVLWAFAAWETVRAVDFGFHADETRLIDAVAQSARTGTLLPGWYNHPSVSYDLALLAIAPKAVPAIKQGRDDAASKPGENGYDGVKKRVEVVRKAMETKLQPYVRSQEYLLRARSAFAFLAMLSPLWTAIAAFFWRRKVTDAFVAGALMSLSWEVAYHARWIAPDALSMMFASLTLALIGAADHSPRPSRWLYLSAIAASLTFGSRYLGGLMIVLVIATALRLGLRKGGSGWKAAAVQALFVLLLFTGVFALLSPGVWVEPMKTLADLSYEGWHYGEEGHGGHTVVAGWRHLWLILKYLGAASLSRYQPVAIGFALTGLIGLGVLARSYPLRTGLWVLPPVLAILYLSGQRVMIARDLLMVIPFLAVLAGVGVGWLFDRLREQGRVRLVVPLVAGGAMFFNAYWAQVSARSIVDRKTRDAAALTRTWAVEHPRTKVMPSRRACEALGGACRPAMDRPDKGACRAMFWMSELQPRSWPSNTTHFELLGMGPFEVNLDWYSSWTGDDRVVMLACDQLDGFYKEAFDKIAEK